MMRPIDHQATSPEPLRLRSSPRVLAHVLEDKPFGNTLGLIQPEKTCGDLALARKRFNDSTGNTEMVHPLIQSRMKQSNQFPCPSINGRYIGTFVAVAKNAAERQVVESGAAAVFPTYNVIQLMSEG